MKYPKLILSEYKRLMLRDIRYFELTPTTPIQIILGTNGSGKSSIIKELSPLPAEASNYGSSGYKEIHIEHRGDYFVLKSSFSDKKAHHSFIKNKEELNKGGTITVQRELVKAEFNYTQEIHDLLTNQVRFSNMGSLKRRYWITLCSNTNWDYAIKLYNKVAERYRDVTGTLRNLRKRLVAESEKIIDIKTQQMLESEIESIHRDLTNLLELRIPVERTPAECESEFNSLEDDILNLSMVLSRNILRLPESKYKTVEELDSAISDYQVRHRSAQQLTEKLAKDYDKLNESKRILEKTNAQSQDQLSEKLMDLTNKQCDLLNKKNLFENIHPDPHSALNAVDSVTDILTSLVEQLPSNTDMYYSKDTLSRLNVTLQSVTDSIEVLKQKIEKLSVEKKHQELHKDSKETVCPKCKHHWKIGYSEDTYNKVCDDLEVTSQLLNKQLELKTSTEESIARIRAYFTTFRGITTLCDKWPVLRDLWGFILDKKVILENPNSILNILPNYRANLVLDQQHSAIGQEIERVKELMRLASSVGNQDISKLLEEMSVIENELQNLSREVDECTQQIRKLRTHKSMIQEIESMRVKLVSLLGSRTTLHEEVLEAHRRTMLNNAIKHVNTTLARKEGAIAEIRGQRAIIADIESQISMLQDDEESLKLLVQELSPKEGLIAEGLFGFIKVFTNQWNKIVLEKVFSYQFSVLPCAVDEGGGVELDYQFPVLIGNQDKPIDDISLTSKGQMELLDLGFVIVAMKHLGLHDFPLILDEFGANLDSSHRSKATNLVKSLMEQHPFPQLFMVNHYDSIYGAFTNAQTTVLCSDNIVIPKDCVYNQHVRINP